MEQFGRRELLMGAGVGTLALAAVGVSAAPAAASEDHERSDLEGGWLITRSNPPDANESIKAVAIFAPGGGTSGRDISPPASANFGSWKSTGERGFVATLWSGDTDPTHGDFTIKIIVTGTQEDEDHISGKFSFVVFNDSGNQVDSGTDGKFDGTRIVAGT